MDTKFDLDEIERGLFYGCMYWETEADSRRADGDTSGAAVAQRIAGKILAQYKLVRVMQAKEQGE